MSSIWVDVSCVVLVPLFCWCVYFIFWVAGRGWYAGRLAAIHSAFHNAIRSKKDVKEK
jgi:succinate dehydrogenase hydrophobic anchor subunit